MRTKSVKMYLAMYLAHVINTQKVLATLTIIIIITTPILPCQSCLPLHPSTNPAFYVIWPAHPRIPLCLTCPISQSSETQSKHHLQHHLPSLILQKAAAPSL